MPNRTRSRIGVSVAPDVMDILNEYGRCEFDPDADDKDALCRRCGKLWEHHRASRPTRTEIIERAVREWAKRAEEFAMVMTRKPSNGPERPLPRKAALDDQQAEINRNMAKARKLMTDDLIRRPRTSRKSTNRRKA